MTWQWPFLLLTAPHHHLAACNSSRVNPRRETSVEWGLTVLVHHQFVLLELALGSQSQLCEASGHMLELSWETFICRFFRAHMELLVPSSSLWLSNHLTGLLWPTSPSLFVHKHTCPRVHGCKHTHKHTQSPTSACTAQFGSTACVNSPQSSTSQEGN